MPSKSRSVEDLSAEMDGIVSRFSGEVGYVITNLRSGERLARNATVQLPTASAIKLPILTAFHEHIRRSGTDWSHPVPVARLANVQGSGILSYLDRSLQLTYRDLAWLMICVSDNLATNLITDAMGGVERSAELIHEVVDPSIHLRGSAGGAALAVDAPRSVLSSATPAALGRYLDLLVERRFTGAAETIAVAEQQVFHASLPRYLARSPDAKVPLRIAHKTGSLPGIRTDIGIVAGDTTTLTVVVMTAGSTDLAYDTIHEGERCIGALTHAACRAWLGV